MAVAGLGRLCPPAAAHPCPEWQPIGFALAILVDQVRRPLRYRPFFWTSLRDLEATPISPAEVACAAPRNGPNKFYRQRYAEGAPKSCMAIELGNGAFAGLDVLRTKTLSRARNPTPTHAPYLSATEANSRTV